jgi:hypothetical protein
MRGLYRRGKIFWYVKMVDGARTQLSLETEDQGHAVAKILAMSQQPYLLPVNSYEHEVKAYIKDQLARGKLSHTFASLHAIAGTSIYKIALWLGDGVEVVQKHYAKLSSSDEDINKAFGNKPTTGGLLGKTPDNRFAGLKRKIASVPCLDSLSR